MTQDEIIQMAFDAGFDWSGKELTWEDVICTNELMAFAKLIAASEREACAKVCDEFNFGQTPMMIQRAIRARGEKA